MIHKVTIRKQIISGNRLSLFLDFYPAVEHPVTGKPTRREFLNLFLYSDISITESVEKDKKGILRVKFKFAYQDKPDASGRVIIKPKARKLTEAEKQHNSYVWSLAEQIRQRRHAETNKPEIYNDWEREQIRLKEQGNKSFVTYFETLAKQKQDKNQLVWLAAVEYFKSFIGEKDIRFCDLTFELCEGFRNYLLTTNSRKSKLSRLKTNSALSYYIKFRSALKKGFEVGYIRNNLNGKLNPIEKERTNLPRLTLEELNQLVRTECSNKMLKRAALFSGLTGLRFSDMQALTWRNIEHTAEGHKLSIIIKKTNKPLGLPVSDQAYSLLGERRDPEDKVFDGLVYSATENNIMAKWVRDANINKHITWHSFRRTFASVLTDYGTNIKILSEALGHTHVSATEIYVKVSENPLFREAMEKIKLNL